MLGASQLPAKILRPRLRHHNGKNGGLNISDVMALSRCCAEMFHQGCKCKTRGAEGKRARKEDDVVTFSPDVVSAHEFESLEVQQQCSA